MVSCEHIDELRPDENGLMGQAPNADGCEGCLAKGDTWVHLRRCLDCGYIGCCDSSPNKHATAHNRESGHPVVQSFEPGEDWLWCYDHDLGTSHPPTHVASPAHS